jgi:cysteine desulfuration protein SufE
MEHAATVGAAEARLREDFALLDDYRDKIEYIMDLGKRLPPLPDELKTEANKVRGCQSQVWLVADLDPESGRMRLRADSDAILVRGLIALLLELYDDRRPEEILANPPAVLEEIGLSRFLTPGRANGLEAMVARIRALAGAYAAGTGARASLS